MTPTGLLLLHKPKGISSQAAVTRVKRLFGADKAGHTGTLDPMAEGVLPILLGRAVKASDFLLTGEKHYEAGLLLGVTTDTEDTTGRVLTTSDVLPSEEEVMSVIKGFVGELMQTPPMYSALKVGGRKLCDLARSGETVERTPRPITVYSLSATRVDEREYRLSVHCSKGTYIRTLCADIGAALGTGGVMSSLCRTRAAGYDISRAVTPEALESMTEKERLAHLIPLSEVFSHLPRVTLSDFFARLAHHGAVLYQRKLGTAYPDGTLCALYDSVGFFAVAVAEALPEDDEEAPLAPVLRPIRQFVL